MDYNVAPESFEFTTLKEIIIPLLQNTGYLVDLSTTGIATGYDRVDAITKGFQAGEMSVIVSKPGNGKTAFLLSLLYNIASKSGKTVGVFSPERSSTKMFYRLIESETRQSTKKIISGELTDSEKEQMNAILYNLSKADIYVDDTAKLTKDDFQRRSRQLRNKYGADIIFVDGLESLSCHTLSEVEDDNDENYNTLQDIKEMAKELEIPIVVFSHLSRSASLAGTDELPSLKNVAEYVKAVADSIYIIYRQHVGDIAQFHIAKHANISQAEIVELIFIESIDKFVDK